MSLTAWESESDLKLRPGKQTDHTRRDLRCRLCWDALEIIQHITAECKMLAGSAYIQSIQEHLCRVCACPKVKMVGENE